MNEEEQDIELDNEDLDDSVVAEEHAQESVSKLKGKLKDAEAKAKEYLDGWQRSQADFVNLRKRDEEVRVEFLKFVNADLVSQLIPVLDSLELSLPHGNKELEVIYKQLLSVLKSNGLEESSPTGESFDPKLHEAIGVIETEKKEEDHKILEVVQKSYILQGKIIRPAKVRIGEYKE
ncbi:MAG: nucleotide exchange factor GrpE [Candidatus Zambryskibacteria bacterium]|nr:nucleotide exchange factor GrpE [Candidatus Zambryskibacteria bacterium]